MELSHSKITTLLRCPYSFYLKYIEKVEYLVAPHLYLGGSLHLTFGEAFRKKAEGVEPSPDEVAGIFADFFDGGAYFEDEEQAKEVDWGDENPGEIRETGILIARRYWESISPMVEPLDVEVPFTRQVGVVVLSGRIDLITSEGMLVDLKTTKRAFSERELSRHLQPSLYLLGMGAKEGYFEFHELVKTSNPYCRVTRTYRAEEELSWVANVLLPRVAGQIERGTFPPNPLSFLCDRGLCEVYSYCRR